MAGPLSFINSKVQSLAALKASLNLGPIGRSKFDALNSHLAGGIALEGDLVILGDLDTPASTVEEAYLMRRASEVHLSLLAHNAGADGFLINHFDFLQNLLSYSSIGMGVASDAWHRHLANIRKTLEAIEVLHKEHLKKGRAASRQHFFTERARLFAILDDQLDRAAAYGSGLRNEGSVKRMLGISTKSYLHTGEIAGYAEKIERLAKAARSVKGGAYIGLALDITSAALDIHKACSVGREEECREAKYVRGGGLVGGMGGSLSLGTMGGAIGSAACVMALGIPTGGFGALTCAVIGGAGGGYLGGEGGNFIGEYLGSVLYRIQNT